MLMGYDTGERQCSSVCVYLFGHCTST